MHGDDNQIAPIAAGGLMSAKILKNATLKVYPGFHMACPRPTRTKSMLTCWLSSRAPRLPRRLHKKNTPS
jgi:hypothetical protein